MSLARQKPLFYVQLNGKGELSPPKNGLENKDLADTPRAKVCFVGVPKGRGPCGGVCREGICMEVSVGKGSVWRCL